MEIINYLIKDENYKIILNHQNFNPRIIEYMTQKIDLINYTPKKYFIFFKNNLNNPIEIWKDVFENKINSVSQNVLLVLWQCGNQITIDELKNGTENYIKTEKKSYSYQYEYNKNSYINSLKELEDTFISIEYNSFARHQVIKFKNPSILDFLTNYINKNERIIRTLIMSS